MIDERSGSDRAHDPHDELDASAGGAVLEPLTARERAVSYATARMDFYHATYLTGRILTVTGLIVMLLGFLSVIRRDARRTVRRVTVRSQPLPR